MLTIPSKTAIAELVSSNYFDRGISLLTEYNAGFNKIYLLEDDDKRYLLKVYPTEKLHRIIYSELFFKMKGVSIISPIKSKNGDQYIVIDEGLGGILYPFLNGKILLKRTSNYMILLGKIFGKLHALGKLSIAPAESQYLYRTRNSSECISKLNEIGNKTKHEFIKRGINQKIATIKKYRHQFDNLKRPVSNCYLHGDFHQRNIIFTKETYYLFDFENSHYGILELDLVRTAFSICFKGKFEQRQFEYFRDFIKGYIQHAPQIKVDDLNESITYYFLNNLLGDSFYEDKMLIENADVKRLLSIYRSQIHTIHYLDNNDKYFKDVVTNILVNKKQS